MGVGGGAATAWGGWTIQLILVKEFRTAWVTLLLKIFHKEDCFVSLLPLALNLFFFFFHARTLLKTLLRREGPQRTQRV